MASIKKRNGKWQVRVSYKDKDGTFRTKSKAGFRTKREAEIFATDIQAQSFNGEISINGSTAFPDYFEDWYTLFKKPSISKRTKLTYESTIHVLKNNFSNISIDSITRRDYQKFIKDFGQSHSKATINKINNHVRACVKNAIYDDVIRKDFTENVSLVFDPNKTRKIDYLNIDEMNRLTNYLLSGINHHYTSRHMILLAIYTGMRLGEIQALTWSDINFNFKTISVNKAWNEIDQEFKDTKNEGSNRIIRINQTILNLLTELKNFRCPKSNKEQIFINQFNTVPTSDAVNKTLRNTFKALRMKKQGFHFHSLRHTHVAYLLANHVELYIISKRLGHTDMTTTIRTYSYLIDEYKVLGDDQIENVLDNIGGNNNDHQNGAKSVQNGAKL